MLLLTRRQGEEIVIGGVIVVKVVKVRGNDVQLGIEAPKDVKVNRREVENRYLIQEGEGI